MTYRAKIAAKENSGFKFGFNTIATGNWQVLLAQMADLSLTAAGLRRAAQPLDDALQKLSLCMPSVLDLHRGQLRATFAPAAHPWQRLGAGSGMGFALQVRILIDAWWISHGFYSKVFALCLLQCFSAVWLLPCASPISWNVGKVSE